MLWRGAATAVVDRKCLTNPFRTFNFTVMRQIVFVYLIVSCYAFPIDQSKANFDSDFESAPLQSGEVVPPTYKARIWIPQESESGYIFPEDAMMSNRSRTGICFSGGGYRSYISSVAYLRALLELDLLKDTRHIVGTSGGSWAVAIYSYGSRGKGFAASDAELLGDIVEPENITLAKLRMPIPPSSARSAATRRYFLSTYALLRSMLPSFLATPYSLVPHLSSSLESAPLQSLSLCSSRLPPSLTPTSSLSFPCLPRPFPPPPTPPSTFPSSSPPSFNPSLPPFSSFLRPSPLTKSLVWSWDEWFEEGERVRIF